MRSILYYTCSHQSADIVFWEEVRKSLTSKNYHLVIVSTSDPQYVAHADRRITTWKLTLSPEIRARVEEQLDWARLEQCADGYAETFDRTEIVSQALSLIIHLVVEQPSLVMIYNDRRRVGNLLRQICTHNHIPYLIVERLPWPTWISVDPGGMLLECKFLKNIPLIHPCDCPISAEYERVAGRNETTWWAQPRVDNNTPLALIIPLGKKVLLFIHQVDEDAQNFIYNPFFKNNAEALAWVVRSLPSDESVFILGKHHPKSTTSAHDYATILGRHGYWSMSHTMEECLAAADAIVAVNSSLLFEAILSGKPVGCLGLTVLHGRDVFIELSSKNDTDFIRRLLVTPIEERSARLDRFRYYTEKILVRAFCVMPSPGVAYASRGPEALGQFLAENARSISFIDTSKLRTDVADCLNTTLTEHTSMRRSRIMRLAWMFSRALRILIRRR